MRPCLAFSRIFLALSLSASAAFAQPAGYGARRQQLAGYRRLSASPGRSRTASACSATRPISCAMSRPAAATACLPPNIGSSSDTDGLGWAKDVVADLCLDNYGQPARRPATATASAKTISRRSDHLVGVAAVRRGAAGRDLRLELRRRQRPAAADHRALRAGGQAARAYGKPTIAAVGIPLGDGTAQRVSAEIEVRDVLIAGLGDSIAAGEGNPDRPVALDDRLLLPALPRRRRAANISGRAAPATRRQRPATNGPSSAAPRPATGTATARAG